MKDDDVTSDRRIGSGDTHPAAKLKQNLPYAGISIVIAALIITHAGRLDAFSLLMRCLILIFGYVAAVIDIKTNRIPNELVLTMLAGWVITMTPGLFLDTAGTVPLLLDSIAGFATGGGLFLLVYLISRNGLGGGDVKFMAGAGLYLGFSGALTVMLYGTILAALTGLTLVLLKKIGRRAMIPLAPFLYIGILITIFLQ
jgi:prepilin signal peptidase PulO-like enzyme (type II secretory pathway)